MILYREARKCEIEKVAKLCADSFMQYPLYQTVRNIFNNENSYSQFMYELQLLFVRVYMKRLPVLVGVMDNIIVSVAMLEYPDRKKPSLWNYIVNGGLKILKYISPLQIFGFLNLIKNTETACAKIKEPRWFLTVLAVDKNCQGKQLGSKMIQDGIIPYVKKHRGKLLTFTTNTELNCKFYIKNGFIPFDKRTLQYNGINVENWSFKMGF